MKPVFKHSVKGFRGVDRTEDLVYCKYNHGELVIARKLPQRQIDDSNRNFGMISSNLRLLYRTLSFEYQQDLSSYTMMYRSLMYNPHKISLSAYSLFTKMMWKLKKLIPEADLSCINKEDILQHEFPIKTIAEAMKAGLLLHIEEAGMLTSKI